ncbi:MAG: hypothetical protein ACYC3O_07265 [Burkholderiales bacterium]
MKSLFIVGLIVIALSGCDKIASISGGPADGHDYAWYKSHPTEAKTELAYCNKKYYTGPNMTKEEMAKVPKYCLIAAQVIVDEQANSFFKPAQGHY